MNDLSPSRRRFLLSLATAVAAVPLLGSLEAEAAAAPHLAETDANAKALGYVEDATKAAKEATYKKGAHCASCSLFQASSAAGGYGPCAAFPGKTVNANGWCRAYAAKA